MGFAVFEKLWDTSNNLKHTDIKIKQILSERINVIPLLPEDSAYPSLPYSSAPALIFASWFPRKEITEKFEVGRKWWAVENAWFTKLHFK